MGLNLSQNAATGLYSLDNLTVRQLGLLRWMAGTTLEASDNMSALENDAAALWEAASTDARIRDATLNISGGIDQASDSPIIDEVVRYAPEHETS
jgi:hypothetical protein